MFVGNEVCHEEMFGAKGAFASAAEMLDNDVAVRQALLQSVIPVPTCNTTALHVDESRIQVAVTTRVGLSGSTHGLTSLAKQWSGQAV